MLLPLMNLYDLSTVSNCSSCVCPIHACTGECERSDDVGKISIRVCIGGCSCSYRQELVCHHVGTSFPVTSISLT